VEICEDLWMMNAPSKVLFMNGVDIIFGANGSCFEKDKLPAKVDLVKGATKNFGGAYVYTNILGC
jgi:predicted amidohydrolase